MSNYRIAVLGDKDSVLGFKALGLDVYPAENVEEARRTLHALARENVAVIYLTEGYAAAMAADVRNTRSSVRPHPRHHPDPRQGRLPGHRHGQCQKSGRTGRGRGYPLGGTSSPLDTATVPKETAADTPLTRAPRGWLPAGGGASIGVLRRHMSCSARILIYFPARRAGNSARL